MELKYALASVLISLMLLAYINPNALLNWPRVEAQGNEKVWGSKLTIHNERIVPEGYEIPQGHFARALKQQQYNREFVEEAKWNAMMAGDMNQIKNDIESQIPGASVIWIRVSWTEATRVMVAAGVWAILVAGYQVEAIVENVNAGLTGLEIVAIILVITWLISVIALLSMGSWVVYEVINAIKKLPEGWSPWVMIIVGLLILVGIGALLFFIFGGAVMYKSKKRSVSLGKGSRGGADE